MTHRIGSSHIPRQTHRLGVAAAVMLAVAMGTRLNAQTPATLPTVVVTAKPGPHAMGGVARDTAHNPIQDAEVSIAKVRRRTFTRPDGSFRLDSLPPGTYDVRARKIGFASQTRRITVDSSGGIGDFELAAVPRGLPVVVSSATRMGLGGVVGDTAYRAVAGAEVRVLGNGMATLTDSVGSFFLPVKKGGYMVAVMKQGFADKLASVTIPEDSGRRITVFLQPSSGKKPRSEFWNIADLRARMAWRNKFTTAFYTREQMQQNGVEWVYDAVSMATAIIGSRAQPPYRCYAYIDGGPRTANVNNLTVDEVESVEVYSRDMGGGCPLIFVWMR